MVPAETLVLRFRDLLTAKGGTVREYQEVIKSKGHVFWGWWNKLVEQPAFEFILNAPRPPRSELASGAVVDVETQPRSLPSSAESLAPPLVTNGHRGRS